MRSALILGTKLLFPKDKAGASTMGRAVPFLDCIVQVYETDFNEIFVPFWDWSMLNISRNEQVSCSSAW